MAGAREGPPSHTGATAAATTSSPSHRGNISSNIMENKKLRLL